MQKGNKRLIMLAWSWCVPCSIESVFLHKNEIPFTHVHIPPESPEGLKTPFVIGHGIWKKFVDPGADSFEVHSPVFILVDDYPRIFQMSRNEAKKFVEELSEDDVLVQPSFGELINKLKGLNYEIAFSVAETFAAVAGKVAKKAAEEGYRFKKVELEEATA